MRVRRKRLSGAQLRNGSAINVDERTGRIPIGPELRKAGCRIAERADEPQTIAGTPAGAIGHAGGGPADHGHAEDPRRAAGKGDSVPADQRKAVALARMLDAGQEFVVPSLSL